MTEAIEDLSYRELQKECKARGLSAAGTTEALQDRLGEALEGGDEERHTDPQGAETDAGEDALTATEPSQTGSDDWAAEHKHDETKSTYECPECGEWKARPWINPGDRCVDCGGPPGNRA